MKKVFMILGIIGSTFMLIIGLLFFAVAVSENETAMAIFGFVIFAASLTSIIHIGVKNSKTELYKENRRKSKEKFQANLAKSKENFEQSKQKYSIENAFRNMKYKFSHVAGLPIMEGAVCKVVSEHDKIVIEAQGVVLSLNKDKITYIGIEKNIQTYTQAVSSVGGAVGGAMLFGGIGAAIGGRKTSQNFRAKRKYLVITYISDDENVKYVIFEYDYHATSLIKDFKKFNKSNLKKQNVEIK